MKAVMLAAGLGSRMGQDRGFPPKVLLRFDGVSLLERHIRILKSLNVSELVIGVGYNEDMIHEELRRIGAGNFVRTITNHDFTLGAITTLWSVREECQAGGPIVMMDGDVLYDQRLMSRLVNGVEENCLLFDSDIEPGEEPVKICLSGEAIVDFGKMPEIAHDRFGEWVGFTRFSAEQATRIPQYVAPYIERGETGQIYEVAIRDQLIDANPNIFKIGDITGQPWIEIDFLEDVENAERELLPRLEPLA
jgi:choline kinase